jgi:hypothetical protein
MAKTTEELFAQLISESTVELHPDLQPYLEDGVLGPQLRHPLVYAVPLWTKAHANYMYEQKKKDLEKAISEKKYSQIIFLHERPYRLEAFVQITKELPDAKYWSLLASVWTDTENGWQNLPTWRALFWSKRPGRENLMDADERLTLANLPETVEIYRGCTNKLNEDGISWTLNRDKAEFFANRFSKGGLVLSKQINKSDIIAVFNGRGEAEVICNG